MQEKVNVLCAKWGTKYGAEWINRLYAGVARHLARPFRFVCATNEPEGIRPEVECCPLDANPNVKGRGWPNIHAKLTLFRRGFADLSGPTLFLDVDVIICGGLDRFFDYAPGDFCIARNWVELRKRLFRAPPRIGNSSCFRFDAGSDAAHGVYESFLRDKEVPELDWYFRKGSQKYQTRAMMERGRVSWWPKGWVCSFKRECVPLWPFNRFCVPRRPPVGSSVVAFHGHPDMGEAIGGYDMLKGRKVSPHLTCRPTPWVKEMWEQP